MKMRVVEIAGNLMLKNDALAARLRGRFAESGTLVVNMLSSPGSGKTTLLEETLRRLSSHVPRRRARRRSGDGERFADAWRAAAPRCAKSRRERNAGSTPR